MINQFFKRGCIILKYIKTANSIGTINVKGNWTLLESHDIEEDLGESYSQGINTYIVDFAGTDSIDYASIQFLFDLQARVGEGKMSICNVDPKGYAHYMLQKAGLTSLIS